MNFKTNYSKPLKELSNYKEVVDHLEEEMLPVIIENQGLVDLLLDKLPIIGQVHILRIGMQVRILLIVLGQGNMDQTIDQYQTI